MLTNNNFLSWLLKLTFVVLFFVIVLFLQSGDTATARVKFREAPCPENTCCGGGEPPEPPSSYKLSVTKTGSGLVTSTPSGINCGATCSAYFQTDSIVTLTATADDNWIFAGWSGAGCSGTGFCDVLINAAKTVTATFDPTLTVTSVGPGTVTSNPAGIDCGETCSATFAFDSGVTLTAAPDAGYIFQGWTGACAGVTPSCTLTMNALKSATATFGPWLTVTDIGSGNVISTPAGIDCGRDMTCSSAFQYNTIVTLTATPTAGWDFIGWSGSGCSGISTCTVTINADHSVTARFQPLLTLIHSGGGRVTSAPPGMDCTDSCAVPFPVGTEVTLTALPDPGYVFDIWEGDCMGLTCSLTMDAPHSVTATFLPLKTLTVNVSVGGTVTSLPAGIDCGSDCTEQFPQGTEVALVPQPDYGYGLSAWNDPNCTDLNVCVVTMSNDTTLTVTFALLPTQLLDVTIIGNGTITSDPAGIDCGSSCSAAFPTREVVQLTPLAGEDYQFTGWSGACSGTDGCVVNMTAPKSVTATFTPLHAVTVTSGSTGEGSVNETTGTLDCPDGNCMAAYTDGSTVTLSASPQLGSNFTGWEGDCSGAGDCTLNVSANRHANALFTRWGVPLTVISDAITQVVTSDPAGISCPPVCTYYFTPGTVVKLYASSEPHNEWFSSWRPEDGPCQGGTPACAIVLYDSETVEAHFRVMSPPPGVTPIPRILTVNPIGSGTVQSDDGYINCPGDCWQDYIWHNPVLVTLTAVPSSGSASEGMFNSPYSPTSPCIPNPGNTTCLLRMNWGHDVDVNLSGVSHPINVSVDGPGMVLSDDWTIECGADCSSDWAQGAQRTLKAYPAPGQDFLGWSGDCSGMSDCVITTEGPKNITATFGLPMATLTLFFNGGGTVTSSPAGIDCTSSPCQALFPINSVIQLTAAPNVGIQFMGFGGDCLSNTTTCNLILTSNMTVSANFAVALYLSLNGAGSIETQATPGGSQTCTNLGCKRYIPYGATAILTATPDTGLTFTDWSGACSTQGNPCILPSLTHSSGAGAIFRTVVTVIKEGVGIGTVFSSPPSINCGPNCVSTVFKHGWHVILYARPDYDSILASPAWTGCTQVYGQATCRIYMDGSSKDVTVTFDPRF